MTMYGTQVRIPWFELEKVYNAQDIAKYRAHQMRMQLTARVVELMEEHPNEWLAMKVHPLQARENPELCTTDLLYTMEVFVMPTRNAYIPELVYDVFDEPKVVEWRCGHCKTPNVMEDRLCTQCGAPRALLVQELK